MTAFTGFAALPPPDAPVGDVAVPPWWLVLGLVVGQLQRKMNRYDWLSLHKVRVRAFLQGSTIMDGWGECGGFSRVAG